MNQDQPRDFPPGRFSDAGKRPAQPQRQSAASEKPASLPSFSTLQHHRVKRGLDRHGRPRAVIDDVLKRCGATSPERPFASSSQFKKAGVSISYSKCWPISFKTSPRLSSLESSAQSVRAQHQSFRDTPVPVFGSVRAFQHPAPRRSSSPPRRQDGPRV